MFGFHEHEDMPNVTCVCGADMVHHGAHGTRIGGLTGFMGAGAAMTGGQMADDGEEAFEKKLEVDVFVCPKCQIPS